MSTTTATKLTFKEFNDLLLGSLVERADGWRYVKISTDGRGALDWMLLDGSPTPTFYTSGQMAHNGDSYRILA